MLQFCSQVSKRRTLGGSLSALLSLGCLIVSSARAISPPYIIIHADADVNDSSVNAFTPSGTLPTTFLAGKVNNAAVFNGSNTVYYSGTAQDSGAFSAWVWFNTTTTSDGLFWWVNHGSVTDLTFQYAGSLDIIGAGMSGQAGIRYSCNGHCADGKWHLAVMTWNGVTRLYFDDVLVATDVTPGGGFATGPWAYGSEGPGSSGGNGFSGLLDESGIVQEDIGQAGVDMLWAGGGGCSVSADGQCRASGPLTFPVSSDSLSCKMTICTPFTVNISSVFDHEQREPYEHIGTGHGVGLVRAYTGETGKCDSTNPTFQFRSPIGSNWGYGQANGNIFIVNGNYTGGGGQSDEAACLTTKVIGKSDSKKFLFYDGHPGYDYPFVFGTALWPAISGCVTYQLDAAGPVAARIDQKRYHTLAIVPSSVPPANGCPSLQSSSTGFVVFYLHLASFVGKDGRTIMHCTAQPNKPEKCPNKAICKTCPQEGTWVSTDRATTPNPIAYVGNFARGAWGGHPHLHFEVDQMINLLASPIPIDPYGWIPLTLDPYTTLHPGITNRLLWK